MTGFLAPKDVVDVEDIIAVLVIIPIVFATLAGFGQNTSWVPRRLVVETGIADAIGGREVGGKRLKGLEHPKSKYGLG